MKKSLLFFVFTVAVTMSFARTTGMPPGEPIPLQVNWGDETGIGNGTQKSPDNIPTVSLDNYTLYFADTFSEVVAIELKDASGTVVYSTNLPIGSQTLVLPATLSGTYNIYIYVGGLCYYGQIPI